MQRTDGDALECSTGSNCIHAISSGGNELVGAWSRLAIGRQRRDNELRVSVGSLRLEMP